MKKWPGMLASKANVLKSEKPNEGVKSEENAEEVKNPQTNVETSEEVR